MEQDLSHFLRENPLIPISIHRALTHTFLLINLYGRMIDISPPHTLLSVTMILYEYQIIYSRM